MNTKSKKIVLDEINKLLKMAISGDYTSLEKLLKLQKEIDLAHPENPKEPDDEEPDDDDGDKDDDEDENEDKNEENKDEDDDEEERIRRDFPPLSNVRADFQLMEYQAFSSYFSDIFYIYNAFEKQSSFEDFLPHVMQEAALYVPTPDENEKDFIKNTRDLCRLSYVEHLFSDILFRQVEMYEVQVEHVIMSREYFLFLANLFEKHYQRTGNMEYEDYFRKGEIFEIPIIISKYAGVPFATYCFNDNPHKKNKECHLPTKREIIRTYPDVFDENGNLKDNIIWGEDLLDQLASSW